MNVEAVQKKILSWYAKNKRDLPWRKTTDPYAILVSEVMLQQTQVDRVIPYYHMWLASFPDFKTLAKAKKEQVLSHWSGLGYNNRALRLQKLAQEVVEKHNGILPKTEEALLQLPGIGPYTAHAVLAFAHNKTVPVVDTNIRRVLIHELKLAETISEDALKTIALQCVPRNKSRIWHNALMDYGALYKTARKTGIKPLSQQSSFAGSTRQVRGALIKYLLKEKKISLQKAKNLFPHAEFNNILAKMEKDELIKKEKNYLTLA